MASLIIEEQIRIPLDLAGLAGFRRWTQSDQFPDRGRIDYIRGDIEVDISAEDLFSHGTLKGEIYATLLMRVKQLRLGHLFTDSTRVCHIDAQLSVEPDIVLISYEAIDQQRVRLVPKASGEADRFVEVEGTPDLLVEIVSDSSFKKDTERLLQAYHAAGVPEYWLVDARGENLLFQIHCHTQNQYRPANVDRNGFQESAALGCRYRLTRERDQRGYWQYELQCVE